MLVLNSKLGEMMPWVSVTFAISNSSLISISSSVFVFQRIATNDASVSECKNSAVFRNYIAVTAVSVSNHELLSNYR